MGRTERVMIEEAPAEVIAPMPSEFRGMRRVINTRLGPESGVQWEERPVVATREECLAGKGDWYDPQLRTWLRTYGRFVKLERDPNITPMRGAVPEE